MRAEKCIDVDEVIGRNSCKATGLRLEGQGRAAWLRLVEDRLAWLRLLEDDHRRAAEMHGDHGRSLRNRRRRVWQGVNGRSLLLRDHRRRYLWQGVGADGLQLRRRQIFRFDKVSSKVGPRWIQGQLQLLGRAIWLCTKVA